MITIHETSQDETPMETDVVKRHQKVYTMHFEPSFFDDKASGVAKVESLLKLVKPDKGFAWASWENAESEVVERLDTADNLFKSIDGTLKIESTSDGRRYVVLKMKSLDPLLAQMPKIKIQKKHAVRDDQTFDFEKASWSRAWKVKIKQSRSITQLSDVWELFSGLQDIMKKPNTPLMVKRKNFVSKLTMSSMGTSPILRAKIELQYSSSGDRLEGKNCFDSTLQISIRKGDDEDEWIKTSKELYKVFYQKFVTSPFCYKGPILKSPSASTLDHKLTREYALFLQASKWQDRDESIR